MNPCWTGACPACRSPMRLGWSQRAEFHRELDFARPLTAHRRFSIAGMSDGLASAAVPARPRVGPNVVLGNLAGRRSRCGGDQPAAARSLAMQTAALPSIGGKVGGEPGHYVVSTARLRPLEGTIFSVTIAGPLLVLESDLAAHTSDPDAHHVPPTGSTVGAPTVLYEAQTAAIGSSSGLIAGNVVCPATGEIEVYADQVTGTRQGAVAYARIPAARIRGAVSALNAAYSNDSANLLAIPHGANRGVGVAVQATSNFLMLSAQAPGNFYIRIRHART